jgi:drug/metabolite transporter (DMT)-like permease
MSPHSYLKVMVTAAAMYLLKDEIPSAKVVTAIIFVLIGNFCVVFENTFYQLIQCVTKKSVISEGCNNHVV